MIINQQTHQFSFFSGASVVICLCSKLDLHLDASSVFKTVIKTFKKTTPKKGTVNKVEQMVSLAKGQKEKN